MSEAPAKTIRLVCESCDGIGSVRIHQPEDYGISFECEECGDCHGRGWRRVESPATLQPPSYAEKDFAGSALYAAYRAGYFDAKQDAVLCLTSQMVVR